MFAMLSRKEMQNNNLQLLIQIETIKQDCIGFLDIHTAFLDIHPKKKKNCFYFIV